jgi:peptidoglycan hydrolase-like protein with peptidoglycan-binding domain
VRGITVDGIFAGQTLTAVRNFQAARGLAVDGIAGNATRAALGIR